jgi:chemotaxis protein methyltransferase CheR
MGVTAEDFTFVADFLREQSAISIGPGKEYLVESRLIPLAQSMGLKDLGGLVTELRRFGGDPAVKGRVVEAMTTNETSFFRDLHPFETLRKQVLPMIAESEAASKSLRIWSAASSTGQELYSIAMLLDAHFPTFSDWNVELCGSDLSQEVVTRSQSGRFTSLEVNRGLPATMLRYFARDGAEYQLDQRIRDRCRFEVRNLIGSWPAQRAFHVIFCRNVLIYFEPADKLRIIQRLRQDLVVGGHLFLGASETSHIAPEGFVSVRLGNTVVYRREF